MLIEMLQEHNCIHIRNGINTHTQIWYTISRKQLQKKNIRPHLNEMWVRKGTAELLH